MKECDFNCDACGRDLCTQGNPTMEPTPEEFAEILEGLERNLPPTRKKGENEK